METRYKRSAEFLKTLGTQDIRHIDKPYLAHLVAVFKGLEAWECGEDVCLAGMFHSIYGTEMFQGYKLPFERRAEVRDLIGERAERLAWVNCVMDRTSFDRAAEQSEGPYRFWNRLTGETLELGGADFIDLCRIHLFDWLEQVPRSAKWTYRRDAYRCLASRLGSMTSEAFEHVYAAAPTA